MKRLKRLFLFAAYDKDGIIDDTLIYYIRHLKRYGDVIFCMDCDSNESELAKIKDYCLHIEAARHGEYDFGSYKRGYIWARENRILKEYDLVYLVNDSVFGPLIDMAQTFRRLESTKFEATGLVLSEHRTHSFLESWFIRLNERVFMTKWFAEFMYSITAEQDKTDVTIKYEHGLTNLLVAKEMRIRALYTVRGRDTYNKPKKLFQQKFPFISNRFNIIALNILSSTFSHFINSLWMIYQ